MRFAVNKFLSMILRDFSSHKTEAEFTDWKVTGLAATSLFS